MLKKGIAIIVIMILILTQGMTCVLADTPKLNPPSIESGSALLMDAETGEILYAKNAHTKRFPASITKIMTCLLALEKALAEDGLQTVITANSDTLNIEAGSSNAAIKKGEELTVEQLLYFAMVVSGNDAANALGQYVCDGDLEAFSALMTKRAEELGCKNTFFWNAHGLNEAPEAQDKHMTTAYDMALIMQRAIEIPMFVELISTERYETPPTNKTEVTRRYTNTNKLIQKKEPSYYYEYCIGGKTGWTTPAGNTLVTYGEKDGRQLICVILKANGRNMAYAETTKLYEYGFSDKNFTVTTLDKALSKEVIVTDQGKMIGNVQVSTDLAQSIYVPAGCNITELNCELVCRDIMEQGTELDAYVLVTFPETWQKYGYGMEPVKVPAIVGEINYLPAATPESPKPTQPTEKDEQSEKDEEKNKGGTVLLIISVIIISVLVFAIIRRYIVWKRRKKKKYWWKEQL